MLLVLLTENSHFKKILLVTMQVFLLSSACLCDFKAQICRAQLLMRTGTQQAHTATEEAGCSTLLLAHSGGSGGQSSVRHRCYRGRSGCRCGW